MKKLIIIWTVLILLSQQVIRSVPHVEAAVAKPTPTPTASPTPTPQPSLSPDEAAQVNQNLKEMIDKVVEENKVKVNQLVQEIQQKRKALLGQVVRVSRETITIKTTKGTQILSLGEETKLIKANKQITPEKVAVDDWALVVGSIVDDTFKPEQILISSTRLRPDDHSVMLGTIQKNTASLLTIQPRSSQDSVDFKITKSTKWLNSTGSSTEKANFSADIQCLVVGYKDVDAFYATAIKALAPFTKE